MFEGDMVKVKVSKDAEHISEGRWKTISEANFLGTIVLVLEHTEYPYAVSFEDSDGNENTINFTAAEIELYHTPTTEFNGVLEVDSERGVILFHLSDQKDIDSLQVITFLRIANLPVPFPTDKKSVLDIMHMVSCNWGT